MDYWKMSELNIKLSQRWHWASQQSISFLMQQAVENPEVISLAAGLVDEQSLPGDITKKAIDILFSDKQKAQQALQYGTTAGSEKLRKQLLNHLANLEGTTVENLNIDSDQIILTTGSQQLLSILSEILLEPEDICLVAAPTYFVYLGVLDGVGANAVPVECDEYGIIPEKIDENLKKLESQGKLNQVRMIYLVTYYENPTGVSLAVERREQIIKIARKWSKENRIHVLEDAAYRELHYDGPVLPSLWSFDNSRNWVILAQTFSKSFAPGLRIGYGVLPKSLVKPVCDRKGNEDFGSAHLNQQILSTIFENELYQTHVESLCKNYQKKRDSMLNAAQKYFSDIPEVHWMTPHGGLYVWMTLPSHVNTGFKSELFEIATKQKKVMYVPGELFYPDSRQSSGMRLSLVSRTWKESI